MRQHDGVSFLDEPMSDDCTSLDPGGIRFYDNFVPTLGVGDYLLNVTQRINPRNVTPPIDECYAASQAFSVQGPRYTLPPEDVFSIFPPGEAQGVFDQFLPHVVLTQRDLPWERNVFNDGDSASRTPWMALLLFVEGEQIGGADALLAPADGSSNRTMTATIPASQLVAAHTGDGIAWPALKQEWYESDDWLRSTQCQVIDVSPQAFAALVPGKSELRYLAHVRQIDPSAKDEQTLVATGSGWYSVLVAGRLPDAPPAGSGRPGRRNIVHLVSLEGLEEYVGGSKPFPDGTTRVRMVSLQNWTFSCLPQAGQSFTELMNGLLVEGGTAKQTAFTLPITLPQYPTADEQYAADAIAAGYVPLRWQTRLGEESFAWYRGPFSAVPVKNFVSSSQASAGGTSGGSAPGGAPEVITFGTASDAIVYDKGHGVFDVSYGVAWETGRLLALSDPKFGQELLAWQRAGHRLTDRILERQSQLASLQNLDTQGNPKPPQDPATAAQPYALTGDFMTHAVSSYADAIAPGLSAPPGETPPPFDHWPDMPPLPGDSRSVTAAAQQDDVAAALRQAAADSLDDVAAWLGQRYLLAGVPFEALVPNAALLPEESVRFFYVDGNWLDALVEGALSIGIECSRDQMYQGMMKDLVWSGTQAAAAQARTSLLAAAAPQSVGARSAPPAPTLGPPATAGLLLRSAAVSGWPGLEVHAYAAYEVDDGTVRPKLETEISALRIDRLSSDVLVCLWPSVPAVVTIDEPHEGVAFGFEDPPQGKGEGDWLYLRSLDDANYGMPCCTDAQMEEGTCPYALDAVHDGLVDPGTRRLRMDTLLSAIQSKLGAGQPPRVRDLAVQMVKVPEQAVFAAPSSPTA